MTKQQTRKAAPTPPQYVLHAYADCDRRDEAPSRLVTGARYVEKVTCSRCRVRIMDGWEQRAAAPRSDANGDRIAYVEGDVVRVRGLTA